MTAFVCALECISALADLRGRFGKLLMFSALGVVHGIVPAVTAAEMYLASSSTRSRLHAAGLAFVGVLLFSAGWRWYEAHRAKLRGLSPRLLAILDSPEGQTVLRRLFWSCAVLGVLGWVVSVMAVGSSVTEVFYRARFLYRGSEETYLEAIAQYFIALATLPGFLCFFLPRGYRPLGVAFALSMALVLFLASQGTRGDSLGLVGALMMGYCLRHRAAVHRVLIVGAAVGIFLLLTVSLYEVRKTMSRQTVGEMLAAVASPETYQGALMRDPLNYHELLVAAVENFPERHPFLNGATYRRFFVFFLPRSYFPAIKPADPNMVFAEVIDPYSASRLTTVPPTMMGDGYINFWGWPGILIMLVNGLVFGYVNWKVRTNVLWFMAIGAMFVRLGVVSVRGQPYEIFLMGVWMLLAVWTLGRLCGFSFRGAAARVEDSFLLPPRNMLTVAGR